MKLNNKNIYISNAVNSLSKCVSWGSWLACGMTKSVVLVNQTREDSKIIQQFTQHPAIVTAVSWISETILISADELSNIIIWYFDINNGNLLKSTMYKVEAFSAAIVDIDGVKLNDNIYVLCSSESRMEFIKICDDNISVIEHRKCDPNFVLSVKLLELGSQIVMLSGLDDGRVICRVYEVEEERVCDETVVLSGHEDWVTCLDSIVWQDGVYVASSSQDSFIRVWKITVPDSSKIDGTQPGPLDIQKVALPGSGGLHVHLDGVLAGHENWVTRARFRGRDVSGVALVTTSMDKSIIVWSKSELEDEHGQWTEEARLGQIGGNGLGFIGGEASPDGEMIVGLGYQGDMVVWGRDNQTDRWATLVNIGGHFQAVEDLAWDSETGLYLVTVSKDQTARLHAPWVRPGRPDCWHEIGRPQIHGFDMTAVASIGATSFVTGADEKISRVFAMNRQFNRYLKLVCGTDGYGDAELRDEVVSSDALGLSNRFVEGGPVTATEVETADVTKGVKEHLEAVPNEENISGRTLWPEVTKLYGHVYELFRISSHAAMRLVATSCKASTPEYADIILWDMDSWTITQRLPFHKSTVVRVQFNKAGNKIVSVSKDRQWALWKLASQSPVRFELVDHSKKPNNHTKIIWDVDWTFDDSCFVTVSRDKKMMLWQSDSCSLVGKPLVFSDSVNAISTMPVQLDQVHVFAVGLENGDIKIVQFDKITADWSILLSFNAHHDWITRLRFNPVSKDGRYLLASCSKDRFVKIFEITFE